MLSPNDVWPSQELLAEPRPAFGSLFAAVTRPSSPKGQRPKRAMDAEGAEQSLKHLSCCSQRQPYHQHPPITLFLEAPAPLLVSTLLAGAPELGVPFCGGNVIMASKGMDSSWAAPKLAQKACPREDPMRRLLSRESAPRGFQEPRGGGLCFEGTSHRLSHAPCIPRWCQGSWPRAGRAIPVLPGLLVGPLLLPP